MSTWLSMIESCPVELVMASLPPMTAESASRYVRQWERVRALARSDARALSADDKLRQTIELFALRSAAAWPDDGPAEATALCGRWNALREALR